MIEKMTKYSFVLLSGKTEEFLSKVESLGLVDITRSAKPVDERSSALFASTGELQKAIGKMREIDWSKDPDLERIKAALDPDARFDNPLESFKDEYSRLETLRDALTAAQRKVEDCRAWGAFDKGELDKIAAMGYNIRWYRVPKKRYDPSWATLYPLQEVADNGSTVWFVTVSDDPAYSLPAGECAAPEGDIRFAERQVEAIKADLAVCKSKLLALKEYAPALQKNYEKEAAGLQRYLADKGAGKAAEDMITTFEGFAPAENEEQLCKEFDKLDAIYIKENATREDNPPIKFKGNWFTRMFTVLTDMYGRPVYDEFDPTPYISFFFTLFFAMCMGDAGYGLLLVLIGLFMKRKGMDLSPLVITLGSATILAGFVMHTFFGINLAEAAWVPDSLKRFMINGTIAGMDAQMIVAVGIGIVHICLAMVLKTIYSVKRNGLAGSLASLGWTLLIAGGVLVAGIALMGIIDQAATKGIIIGLGIVSAVGIFLLNDVRSNPLKNIGSGLWDTYNMVSGLLGDTLSYIRLYALGLAGGMLGNAFNLLGSIVLGDDPGVLNWPFFILIVVLGHVLNLAMCCLGAFVHPLRLNFLEFFKNSGYEGGGRRYDPLTADKQME